MSRTLRVVVEPAIPVANLLALLRRLGELDALAALPVDAPGGTLEGAVTEAARLLAAMARRRLSRGLARDYRSERVTGASVGGKLDLRATSAEFARGRLRLVAHRRVLDFDVVDNVLVLQGLRRASHAGLYEHSLEARETVRLWSRAVREGPSASVHGSRRGYHPQNADYEAMHRLGALVSQMTGQTLFVDDTTAVRVGIRMAPLFERCLGQAARSIVPTDWQVVPHRRTRHGTTVCVEFDPDYVILDGTGNVRII